MVSSSSSGSFWALSEFVISRSPVRLRRVAPKLFNYFRVRYHIATFNGFAQGLWPYKGYFIEGSALLVHPFSPDWYVGGSVLVPGRSGSVVEIGRFRLHRFTVSIKGLTEWFGVEVARIVVDECFLSDGTEWPGI